MPAPNWANQTVWTGDNLPIMRGMNSASVDLIYLDPPFNSKANYAAPIGSKAAGAAFKDTWTLTDVDAEWINLIEAKHPALYRVLLAAMSDSDKSYLAYMAVRLLEMRRLLKPTGSIYLHCDPTMSHYLKLVMDAIFGRRNLINEVVWYYRGAGTPKTAFARRHDVLLWYAFKSGQHYFDADPVRQPYAETTKDRFSHYIGNVRQGSDYGPQTLNPLGKHPDDVITTIQPIAPSAKARLGYPTQKPVELLHHLIDSSCPDDDGVLLDPFCGCATACIAAEQRQRQWVGIDISAKAAELVALRFVDEIGRVTYDGAHRTDIPKRTDLGKLPPYNCQANRQSLYGLQAGNCGGCGEHFGMRHFEVDHIIARKKGGTDHLENLQLLCGNCNRIKGDRGMEYLRTKLQL
ncbi:MAG: hypothetical protein F4187_06700 [Gemmatimonadetes bacterium]|nr:hypothetical protein [Gemmatimonadota bacterium]